MTIKSTVSSRSGPTGPNCLQRLSTDDTEGASILEANESEMQALIKSCKSAKSITIFFKKESYMCLYIY